MVFVDYQVVNDGVCQLQAGIGASDTTIVLESGHGTRCPSGISGSTPAKATLVSFTS